jgi:hypothetical protein
MRDNQVEETERPVRLEQQLEVEECKTSEYRPSRMECLRDYNINIRFLTVGCVIEVGCKSIPFTTIKEGMEALNEYVARPYETRQAWEKIFQEGEK